MTAPAAARLRAAVVVSRHLAGFGGGGADRGGEVCEEAAGAGGSRYHGCRAGIGGFGLRPRGRFAASGCAGRAARLGSGRMPGKRRGGWGECGLRRGVHGDAGG